MKNYKDGIIIGIISILSSLILTGIPIGSNILEIIELIIYILGILIIIYLGLFNKNSKNTIITYIIYIIVLLILTGIIELQYKDFKLIAIGFIPGLIIGITGLILTKSNKKDYKTNISIIINTIGIIISLLSLILIIPNGGLIIN